MARLAADLLGMDRLPRRVPGHPRGRQSPEWRRYDAELRKLEEYRQGKYRQARGERRSRIAALGGTGNPYGPVAPLRGRLGGYRIALGARADWRISEDWRPFEWKHMSPESGLVWGPAHAALANGVQGLLDALITVLNVEYGADLVIDAEDHEGRVYALQVQARKER
jgi:hypothetical protein